MLYLDNGPVAKSGTFRRVMTHWASMCGRTCRAARTGGASLRDRRARSSAPFRTVKEAHETLYHFHTPQNEAEANLWLRHYLVRYNAQPHRSEQHSRAEDWSSRLPEAGLRAMCAWDRFRTFAREPERRRVGIDARVQVDGVSYEVDPSLAGETVTLWWGLFDQELFVEHADQRFGPFGPIDGPIPLHRYRSFRKSTADERLDRIEALAGKLGLPRAALDGSATDAAAAGRSPPARCRSTIRTRSGNSLSQHSRRQARDRRLSRPPVWRSWRPKTATTSTRCFRRRWTGAPSSPACGAISATVRSSGRERMAACALR